MVSEKFHQQKIEGIDSAKRSKHKLPKNPKAFLIFLFSFYKAILNRRKKSKAKYIVAHKVGLVSQPIVRKL
jgi:hypothetical protein